MGKTLRTGTTTEVVTFVETLLPDGVDAIRVDGIEYVTRVVAVADMPRGVAAIREEGTAFVREALQT